MNTATPFAFADRLIEALGPRLSPPPWAVSEVQTRLVLLLNHVLMQEPQAMQRLARQRGRVMQLRWRQFSLRLAATPAGLLELAAGDGANDLTLTLTDESAARIAQQLSDGQKPAVRIEGDVMLAAEVNWLVDHVRWDLEEDLSRVIGDAAAHALVRAARHAAQLLRGFASRRQVGA